MKQNESNPQAVARQQLTESMPMEIKDQHLMTIHGDALASEAVGTNLPPGYYTGVYFVGTLLVFLRPCIYKSYGINKCESRLWVLLDLLGISVGFWHQIV